MATQPSNDLLVIAEEDTTLESTGLANKTIPSSAIREVGWDKGQQVNAEHLNFSFNNLAQWIQYTIDTISELQATVSDLSDVVDQRELPVGSIYENVNDDTNPADLFGYGTWGSYAAGQVLVGTGTFEDTNGDSVTWSAEDTAGEYNHTMTESELVAHAHDYSGTTEEYTHNHTFTHENTSANTGGGIAGGVGSNAHTTTTTDDTHSHDYSGTTESTGGSEAFNVMQPTLAVYRWIRTA